MALDWWRLHTDGRDAVMGAVHRSDVDDLNGRVHALLEASDQLGPLVAVADDRRYCVGDSVLGLRNRYDLGILGSTGSLTGSWDIQNGCGNINTTQGGFESINRNANLTPTASNEGYACVDPHIRLLADVPEPSILALLGLGLLGLRFGRRK